MLYIIIIGLCIIPFAILFAFLKPFIKLFTFNFYRKKLKKKENEYKAEYKQKLEYNKDAKENPAWYKFQVDLESEVKYINKKKNKEADEYVGITTFVASLILTISGCTYFFHHQKNKQIVQTEIKEKQNEIKTIGLTEKQKTYLSQNKVPQLEINKLDKIIVKLKERSKKEGEQLEQAKIYHNSFAKKVLKYRKKYNDCIAPSGGYFQTDSCRKTYNKLKKYENEYKKIRRDLDIVIKEHEKLLYYVKQEIIDSTVNLIATDISNIDKIPNMYRPIKNVINIAAPLKKISKEKGCKACKIFMDCEINLLKSYYGKSNNTEDVFKCKLLKDQSGRNKDYSICTNFRDFEKQKWTEKDHELTQKIFSEYSSLKCQPIESTKCQKELMIEEEKFHYSLHCGKLRDKFYHMRSKN